METFIQMLGQVTIESAPKMEGKTLIAVVAPSKQ